MENRVNPLIKLLEKKHKQVYAGAYERRLGEERRPRGTILSEKIASDREQGKIKREEEARGFCLRNRNEG